MTNRVSIQTHLQLRGVDFNRTRVFYDNDSYTAHFLLYNLSGQLVGYQRYSADLPKQRCNEGRYFTHITEEGPRNKKIAVYGLETITYDSRYLFVVEGIFDAIKIHNAGYPAIAVLQNNPKMLRSWLPLLNLTVIVICDNDAAGKKMAKFGHKSYDVPNPFKDLGEMPQAEVNSFLTEIVNGN